METLIFRSYPIPNKKTKQKTQPKNPQLQLTKQTNKNKTNKNKQTNETATTKKTKAKPSHQLWHQNLGLWTAVLHMYYRCLALSLTDSS